MTSKLFSVWQGVYSSFAEAGGDLEAFDSDIWINKQKSRIDHDFQSLEDASVISKSTTSRDYPLPLIVAMLLNQKDHVKILDFGGGMGGQYLELLNKVPSADKCVDYIVVDNKKTIASVPNRMRRYERLRFHSQLDELSEKVDIVHIGSTLQYIENWKGLLTALAVQFTPRYFVFSDLLAGEVPTFVSHQIFYGKKIPHLFLNLDEFHLYIEEEMGFKLYTKQNSSIKF